MQLPIPHAGSIKQVDGLGQKGPPTAAAPTVRLPPKPICIKLIDTLGRNTTPATPARADTRGAHRGAQKETERHGEIYKKVTRKEHT